jgi:hypothetical protein
MNKKYYDFLESRLTDQQIQNAIGNAEWQLNNPDHVIHTFDCLSFVKDQSVKNLIRHKKERDRRIEVGCWSLSL